MKCGKHGTEMQEDRDECGQCDGWGFEDDVLEGRIRCWKCHGDGIVDILWCDECNEEDNEGVRLPL